MVTFCLGCTELGSGGDGITAGFATFVVVTDAVSFVDVGCATVFAVLD